MDEETQNRIKEALDTSILKEIRSYTGSLKTFVLNVSAGVVSGILFAAILILIGRIYQNDPSPIQVGNLLLNGGQSDHVAKPVADPHPAPSPPK